MFCDDIDGGCGIASQACLGTMMPGRVLMALTTHIFGVGEKTSGPARVRCDSDGVSHGSWQMVARPLNVQSGAVELRPGQ